MALQVWLPLINDLQNYGIGNATISGTGTFTNDGKIGKCLSSSAQITISNTGVANQKIWSFCFWGYIISANVTSDWTRIARACDGASDIRIETCPKGGYGNGIYTYCQSNNSSYKIMHSGVTDIVGGHYDQWMHFCMTSDGTTISVYRNGHLDGTTVYDGDGFLNGTFTLENNDKIKKNDFRIYNHCLSKKEVYEISKALVVHYPLANNGLGFPNMVDNSGTFNGWSIGSGWTKVITDDGSIGYQFTRTGATSNNWVRIIPTLKIDGNNYPNGITVSMDLLTPDKSVINQKCLGSLQQYNSEGSRTGWYEPWWDVTDVVNGKWSRVSFFFTQSALLTNSQGLVYSYTQFSFQLVQNGDITIRRIKVEAGNKKTPYSISEADDINTTIEYDASGYKNNGTRGGTITISDNTPRNTCSTVFNGTNSFIACGRGGMITGATEITICHWCYAADWTAINTLMSCTEGGGYSWGKNGSNFTFWVGTGTSSNTYKTVDMCALSAISAGWHFIAGTYDGLLVKVYLDGVLKATTTAYSTVTPMFFHGSNGLFIAAEAGGNQTTPAGSYSACQISDFRIYSKALSADDILALYNTPISLNKHSLITNGEYIEQ